jgi:HicB family
MATARAERVKAPEENGSHSGRLLLRMPPSLHSELAQAAERQGLSLNAYITRILLGTTDDEAQPRPSRVRLLRYAVIADLVLVAVAAVVAVALLIAAWP